MLSILFTKFFVILIDKELQFEIRAKLNKEDFYIESHKLIFDSICSVLDNNKPVDIVILSDEMSKTSPSKDKRRKVDLAVLAKEMEKVNAEYTKLSAMLNNQGFITKAPEAKVKEIKDRVEELTGMIKNLEELQKKYQ